jgi:glycosyltransferase involved in cell wall biosynthesis
MNYALLFLILSISLHAKIRLLTFHFNRPDFIEIQAKAFKQFMQDDYELIVFNDGGSGNKEAIEEMCHKLQIQCIRFEPEWHETAPLNELIYQMFQDPSYQGGLLGPGKPLSQHPSVRHCHVIQYALDHFGYNHDDIVAIVDGDLFPIRPLYLRQLLAYYQMIGIERPVSGCDMYLWSPFIALDMPKLPDKEDLRFHVDLIDGYIQDSGAHSYHYMRRHPEVPVRKYKMDSSRSFVGWDENLLKWHHNFTDEEIELTNALSTEHAVEFHMEHRLMHYGTSSFSDFLNSVKSDCVKSFFKELLH